MHISETLHSDYSYRIVNHENCMELINQHRYGPVITLRLKGVITSYTVHLTVFTVSLYLTVTYWAASLDRETVHCMAIVMNDSRTNNIYIGGFQD
jgi:hypothetical protein